MISDKLRFIEELCVRGLLKSQSEEPEVCFAKGKDFEFEIQLISKSEGLSLECFDFVVETFQRPVEMG